MPEQLPHLSRRHLLAAGLGAATAIAVPVIGAPATAEAATAPDTTDNGWPIVKDAQEHAIEGSDLSVRVLPNVVAIVLLHVARRFHYEIDAFRDDVPNEITGHSDPYAVAQQYESNYFSATAIAIRPDVYPIGISGGFFPHELIVIRDILAQCDGVVRWGGDEPVPKESHFQIDLPPGDARLRTLSAKIGTWNRTPGRGAGAEDPFRPERIKAARRLEQQQRKR